MQLSNIRAEVRLRMGITETDQALTSTVLNTLINAAVRQVNARYEWPWLEARASYTTTAGDAVIPETSDGIRKMRWVRKDNDEIIYRNYRDTADYVNYEGTPVWYTEEGGVYTLLPTPDAAYAVEYGYLVDAETVLSGDTDEPLIPDSSIDLLITRTAVLVARRIRDRELERMFYAEYERMVKDLRDNMAESTEGTLPRRVGRSGGTRR